jgi:membrane-bound ClpP family serine protease
MKLRLIVMGCIISVLGCALLIVRGYSPELVGLLVVGIVVLVVGLLWKQTKKAENIRKDTN